jgi:hypothetical protein
MTVGFVTPSSSHEPGDPRFNIGFEAYFVHRRLRVIFPGSLIVSTLIFVPALKSFCDVWIQVSPLAFKDHEFDRIRAEQIQTDNRITKNRFLENLYAILPFERIFHSLLIFLMTFLPSSIGQIRGLELYKSSSHVRFFAYNIYS